MNANHLIVLGDSIARGVMYDAALEKYTLSRNTFEQALKAQGVGVQNYSKPGCTVEAAFPILKRLTQPEGAILAIELGGNDSDLPWSEVAQSPQTKHPAAVPLENFVPRLKTLVEQARQLGAKPLVVTPLPVVAERYLKWISRALSESAILQYLGSSQYIYRWQERYAYAAMTAAREANCPVFDLRSLFLGRRDFESLMSLDGIHPNQEGHLLIRDAVVEAWNRLPANDSFVNS